MIKKITFLLFVLKCTFCLAQNFEGEIIYKNAYTGKSSFLDANKLTKMMGDTNYYFIQDGNYKSIVNGEYINWQLYLNKDNRLYTKLANSETMFWSDAATNKDSVYKFVINTSTTTVLGYRCEELILYCKSGTQKYYFNRDIKIAANLFNRHLYGNWYSFVENSNSLPLKSIIDFGGFTVETEAIKINQSKLDASIFDIPLGTVIKKSLL